MAKRWNYQAMEEEDFEIAQRIWGYYKAGAKLWTKSQLKDAEDQLHQTTPHIVMDGFDGNKCRIPRTTSMVKNGEGMNEYLAIDFYPIQRLLQGLKPSGKGRFISTAFCTAMPACVQDYEIRPERLHSQEIARRWEGCCQDWLKGPTCATLVETLYSIPLPASGVKKIICFGLGDLDRADRPYIQHAAALTMAEVMTVRTGEQVAVMTQEPDYSPASVQIVEGHGFTVIDSCVRGFIELDDTTMVFTVAPNVPVKQLVTELARPAVMVWNSELDIPERSSFKGRLPDMEPEEAKVMKYQETDPIAPRVTEMLRDEYTTYEFPPDTYNFGLLDICVKKSSASRTPDEGELPLWSGRSP